MKELARRAGKKSGPSASNIGYSIIQADGIQGHGNQPTPMRRQQALRTGEWLVFDQGGVGSWPLPHKTEVYRGLLSGLAYLELFVSTGQERWQTMALSIADYAAKMQLESGAFNWFSVYGWVGNYPYGRGHYVRKKAEPATGWIHTGDFDYVAFYGQLRQTLGTDAYLEQEKRGFAYMQERNFKTLTWFKRRDTKGKTNSSAFDAYSAMTVVEYLLTLDPPGIDRQAAIELAEAILPRVEDSAAVWDRPAIAGMMFNADSYSHSGPSANLSVQCAYLLLLLHAENPDPMKVAKAESMIASVITAHPDYFNALNIFVGSEPSTHAVSLLPYRGATLRYIMKCVDLLQSPETAAVE